jgi:hypothetical protein|tara:strand:- start:2 stop:664 length:663 start_codon:yes stop_codon:yes gene_type:complete
MTSILKTDEIQSQNGGAVVKMQTLKHPSASGNNLTLDSSNNVSLGGTLSAGIISDSVTQPNKYYIQGKLNTNHTASGGVNLYVAGSTSPYFVWNDTLSNSGFDVGSSSNYDFKFTKKGIYHISFSATFHHVTSNTTRMVYSSIRGNGSTSVSTSVLAEARDQIAQTDTGATDYGHCSCSYVGLFDVNDLINFYTDASNPASDAVRRDDTHVSVFLIRAVA